MHYITQNSNYDPKPKKEDIKRLDKVVDKLERRISTLEKKLEPKPKQLSFDFNQDQPLLVEQPCLK
jgi:hypothetical protein